MELSSRSQKKVNSIIKTASELFVKYGYHKVTIDNIASESNVSKVTLYKYFNDKQALFEHILKENYLEEYNELVKVINSDQPFEEKINNVVQIRMRKYYDNSKPIFNNEISLSDDFKAFIDEYTVKMTANRKVLYDFGKKENQIDPSITDETLEMYFKVIQNGLVSTFSDLREINNENLTELLQILYAGVLGCKRK